MSILTINRLSKTDYYMIHALWARTRSPDCATRHGAFITDKDGCPLASGFNGFPKGCLDHLMPQKRPEKYQVVIHAEMNSILNCKTGNLDGGILYVSGPCCCNCLAAMLQVGISKIVYGPIRSSSCDSVYKDDTEDNIKKFIGKEIEIIKWKPENPELIIKELNDLAGIIDRFSSEK